MEKQKMEAYIDRQKPRIEKFLNYHYKNIETVTITGIKKNPMGGFSIKGYINNKQDLTISVPAELGRDIEYVNGLANQFFDNNEIYPEKESKTVSEIEEEERTTLSFNEKWANI